MHYLYYMQNIQKQTFFELLEGTDQPELFVEIWHDIDYAAFLKFKSERLEPSNSSIWYQLDEFIVEGLSKLHIWHFGKTDFPQGVGPTT